MIPVQIGDILSHIAAFIRDGLNLPEDDVQISNIAFNETGDSGSRIIISLVNVEEEKALRYAQTQTFVPPDAGNQPRVFSHNPVIFINLYILFSFPRENGLNFETSLNDLGSLLGFFQGQYVFTNEDATEEIPFNLPDTLTEPPFEKLIFELYTLSFEQMNHLWGVLGGKYIPSVMYKVRLIPIKDESQTPQALIKRQQANLNDR